MKTLLDICDDGLISLSGVKYKLIGVAGQGGSSIVYKARKEGAAEDYYMIKEFYPHDLAVGRNDDGSICFAEGVSDILEKRMLRAINEYKTVDKLRHGNENNNPWFLNYSNPVNLNNTLYTVIQTEEGAMLSERIHSGAFSGKRFIDLCDYVLKILDAIEPIHSKEYLHLDISPDNIHHSNLNIMRMIDYNSAFPLSGNPDDFLPSYKLGYSAPELKKNIGVSSLCYASDLFSVAAILFELLIGRPPEQNDWVTRSRWMLTSEEGVLKGASGLLVKATNSFLRRSLSSKPEIRPQSVAQMRKEINLLIELSESFVLVNSPKRPNPKFVCRESEIEAIGKSLDSDSYVILEGMGGIGKTELVKKYAWENQDKYEAIQFVTYSNNLMSTIALSLEFHNLDKAKESEYETRYGDEAIRYMYRDKVNSLKKESGALPCLIIVDNYNVTADDDFAEFVSGDFKVVFTSRNKHEGNALEITEMKDEDHLLELFRNYYEPSKLTLSDEATVMNIIRLVLGHTMTVMLIAVAMQKSRITPSEMYERLRSGLDPKLRTKVGVDKEEVGSEVREQVMYQHITNLFDMTQIHDDPNFSFIMTNMAIVPYTGMDITTFYDWALKDHYWVDGCDDRDFSDIEKLIELRWIQADEETQHISLHPVISDVAYRELKPNSETCSKLIKAGLDHIRYEINDWTYQGFSNVVNLMEPACNRISDKTPLTTDVLYCYANYNYFLAEYLVALEFYNKSLEIRKTIFGETHPETISLYDSIAKNYYRFGEYTKALEWYKKSFEIKTSELSNDESEIALSAFHIGVVYEMQTEYTCAMKMFQKSLKIYENLSEKEDDDFIIATLCSHIGVVYEKQENYHHALKWQSKALDIRERCLGDEYLDTADSYHNIATVYYKLKDYDKALEFYLKALRIRESIQGNEHPETGESYKSIADVYNALGDFEKSMEMYSIAFEIFEKKLSDNHPHRKEHIANEYRNKASRGGCKCDK